MSDRPRGVGALSPEQRTALALVGAGLAMAFSLPPWGFWPLAPVGLAVLFDRLEGVGWLRRLRRSWLAFAVLHLVADVWIIDLTIPGYLVAAPVLALMLAIPMALVPARGPWRLPTFVAALVVGEAWRIVFPFGGVPMSNLALGQLGAPWAGTARVTGALTLVAVVAAVGAAVGEVVRGRPRPAVGALGGVLGVMLLALVAPDGRMVGFVNAAVVQGGGELGTRAADTPDDLVIDRHFEASGLLDAEVDLVIWPETVASAAAPVEESPEVARVAALAADLGAVVVVGLNELPRNDRVNAVVAVMPDGSVSGRYDKVHLVPFGEYVPLRSVVEPFADLSAIGTEISPGTGPAVLTTPIADLAPPISWEIYYADRAREGVLAGAQLIVNPTLASSYRTTMVPEQSLASARLRAIETGRWVLQASTTGYSAIVDHRGDVRARTGLREQAVRGATVELRRGGTWATTFGKLPLIVVAVLTLAGMSAADIWSRRRPRISRI